MKPSATQKPTSSLRIASLSYCAIAIVQNSGSWKLILNDLTSILLHLRVKVEMAYS